MFTECTAENRLIGLGIRSVAKVPIAAVNAVNELAFTAHNTKRHAAANDFAVSNNVCFHAKPALRAGRMNTEPVNHVIKNQRRSGFARDLSQLMQKLTRLHIWAETLQRFHSYGCQ